MRAVALLTAVLLSCGCAGTSSETAVPAPEITHGGVDELQSALTGQRLPCVEPMPEELPPYEESVRCLIDGEQVVLVHFFSEEQAQDYETSLRRLDKHGVFTSTWAAETETAELAEEIAQRFDGTTFA